LAFSVFPDSSMPFKHPCMPHALFYKCLSIIAGVSVAHFPRSAQHLKHTL
jgi:hypothetical protein